MYFVRSNLLKDYTIVTENKKLDLPVNPLSHLYVTISGYNVTDEATLSEILSFINSISVTRFGTTIFFASGEDIAAINCYLFRAHPVLTHNVPTDNAYRSLTFIVPFGRNSFDPNECLTASRKGELQLTLDLTQPTDSFDNAILQVEAVELIGATPETFLKVTTKHIQAPSAAGDHDVDIPIGNKIAAIILYSTTVPDVSSHVFGIAESKVLCNNDEFAFVSAKTSVSQGSWIHRLQLLPRSISGFGDIFPSNHILLDFDPNGDSKYLLDTNGLSSCVIRNYMELAEPSRAIFLEICSSKKPEGTF